MAHLFFAASIQRHIETPEREIDAHSVGEAFDTVFGEQPRLRGYILDDRVRCANICRYSSTASRYAIDNTCPMRSAMPAASMSCRR